ncbi:MAG: hypothetical protein WC792_06405 [Candidatus Micrarchaeia archaeon]|jgi:hypothetical protein
MSGKPGPVRQGREPIYIHIPSVRPSVTGCISKWFVHAFSARAGVEAGPSVEKFVRRETDPESRRFLSRLSKQVAGAPAGKLFGREIHLVVVDNAEFFHEKPARELHTPEALERARLLNKVGNPRGVFVHYISPTDMRTVLPRGKPGENSNEFFHYAYVGSREPAAKMGPGGASNLALSYIKTIHGNRGFAYFLRVGDDTFPPVSAGRHDGNGGRLNFFRDLERSLTGGGLKGVPGYDGYADMSTKRLRGTGANLSFIVRRAKPSGLPYYATECNEDMTYRFEGESFNVPNYLIHAGGKSTWYNVDQTWFGSRKFDSEKKVVGASMAFAKRVMARSGLRLPPAKIRSKAVA